MGELYSRARLVFVWLGDFHDSLVVDMLVWIDAKIRLSDPIEENSDSFWRAKLDDAGARLDTFQVTESERSAIHALYVYLKIRGMFGGMESVREGVEEYLTNHSLHSHLPLGSHRLWTGLTTLIGNKWYKRIWTYQELHMATDTTLLLPHDVVTYSLVEQLAWIAWEARLIYLSYSESDIGDLREDMASVTSLTGYLQGQDLPLAVHMAASSRRYATDPRDYVYALLGLMRATPKESIRVDYALPLPVAFVDAMRSAVLEAATGLPILWELFPNTLTEHKDLPSWCPNFENRKMNNAFQYTSLPFVSQNVIKSFELCARIWPMEHYAKLPFSAWKIDRVMHRSVESLEKYSVTYEHDLENSPEEVADLIFCLAVEINHWFRDFDESFPWSTSASNITRMKRSLCAVRPLRFHQRPGADQELLAEIMLNYCNLAAESEEKVLDAAKKAMMVQDKFSEIVFRHFDSFFKLLHFGNILATESGRFGYSALPVMKGDLIIYVPGGKQLHVVSADGRNYRTTAKIDGYMNDDLFSIIRNPEDDLETFHLT